MINEIKKKNNPLVYESSTAARRVIHLAGRRGDSQLLPVSHACSYFFVHACEDVLMQGRGRRGKLPPPLPARRRAEGLSASPPHLLHTVH